MNRHDFIKTSLSLSAMLTLNSFKNLTDDLTEQDELMPVLFVGHGSPMNAIEDNAFSAAWRAVAQTIRKPKAILCVSAHWETQGTFVTAMEKPKTIHDFGGFPQALFDVQYPALGSTWLATETQKVITTTPVGLDAAWGLDHGAWSILKHLYPAADVPVVQLSLDYTKNAQYHVDLARQLAALRKKGVLIVGSGNMVHSFQYANFSPTAKPLDWAITANEKFKTLLTANDFAPLIDYQKNREFLLSAPTPEHYLPMLYAAALRNADDKIEFFNDAIIGSSFGMTSFVLRA
jgi:4,5-DOPA dioxygenase extradiol